MGAHAENSPAWESLLAAARGGDHGAEQALFEELYQVVRKHVSFLLAFDASAEDATQACMLQLYRALPSFRGQSSLKTWALAITTRIARRYMARERRHRAALGDGGQPDLSVWDTSPEAAAQLVFLARSLGRLTRKKREAFVHIELLGLTAEEAGTALGVSPNTAASRCRHARLELGNLYKKV